ncbi:MAG: hypothetical protein A3K19_32085 [Lentisphaerae bacterium RIFOXYB12_FULL_65_16]|nr:MAG: hypothetical protein A3K18_10865 [Lentisphaerae bacterium RIFOXYA12_64_32]OGV88742.1 MAG: hypothetical protein A3K19_32085 [Lentisphaerae bacterium RIFOXYB12_FULL_65_16]
MNPDGMLCIIPSRMGVGEEFGLSVKLTGPVRAIPSAAQWNTPKPALRGPFNLNAERRIQYLDNCLPEWQGTLRLDGGAALSGTQDITFDGLQQGVFPGDRRPVGRFGGYRWTEPGFHFLRVIDPASGLECWANPVFVTPAPPVERIYWGDPHWQTFFSDGIRCPEELYAFARDEAFLDFGAISDHVEALTDRQWDYFIAVTNDHNSPGRFVTLVGQEWTNSRPGHRNIYYRADHGPILRCTDPRYDTLPKLWAALDNLRELDPIAIPHHSANKVMGCDWELGWNPTYEKAVEVYSVWGSSECPAAQGNPRPIRACDGEVQGRHVIDALRKGYRFGFVGGGDIHDGRPGDDLHARQSDVAGYADLYPQGLTACIAPCLMRDAIFDSIKGRRTYATTLSRIYLDTEWQAQGDKKRGRLAIRAASEAGILNVAIIGNEGEIERVQPEADSRRIEAVVDVGELAPDRFCYVRVATKRGDMAWSSPAWGAENADGQ